MYYPDDVIEEVRTSSNIVDVIGSYVHLQKKGSNYFGLCPFHPEKSPSFSVSENKQMYYCFGCGAGGNVFTFLMKYENQTFPEAVRTLADRAGIALPQEELSEEQKKMQSMRTRLLEVNKAAARYYCWLLTQDDGKQARAYLEERRLSRQIQLKFGLGYASKYSSDLYRYLRKEGYEDSLLKESGLVSYDERRGAHDRFWNRVMYPIMDMNSRVIGFGGRVMGDGKPKYMNSPETLLFDKSRNLYGLNYARLSRKPFFILCEGYMDVIAMHQAGFTNAVASLGTALTLQHALLIKRFTTDVRLAYDSDGAGVKAALRAIPILKSAGITSRVIHMDPCKDPDEFIKSYGPEAFEKRIEQAQNSFLFEISILKKQYGNSDPQERADFVKETAKRLLAFPEEIERGFYIEEISREYGIDSVGLKKMVDRLGASLSPEEIDRLREDPQTEEDSSAPPVRRKVSKDESIRRTQRLLLTWMAEDPSLFEKLKDYISADDFTDPLYHQAALIAFDQYEKEKTVTPARILSSFEDAQDQQDIAALFQTRIGSDEDADQEKALSETVIRLKKYNLEQAGAKAGSLEEIQRIIEEKKKLEKLHIQTAKRSNQ